MEEGRDRNEGGLERQNGEEESEGVVGLVKSGDDDCRVEGQLNENVGGLGFGSDLIEGLFGEVSGDGGDGGFVPLGAENWGLSFDGGCLGDLFGEIGSGGREQGCVEEGSSQGLNPVNGDVILKRKVGRPKGSKNKKKSVVGTVAVGERLDQDGGVREGNGEGLSARKRGRPKGSKNKKKKGVEGQLLNGNVEGGDGIVGTPLLNGAREAEDEALSSKRKRGRPKGSKNKKKKNVEEQSQTENGKYGGDRIGSVAEVTGGAKVYENVESGLQIVSISRPEHGEVSLVGGTVDRGEVGGSENVSLKKKRGRPKGSGKKATKGNENMSEGISDATVLSGEDENLWPVVLNVEYGGLSKEVNNVCQTGSQDAGEKRNHRLLVGCSNKQNVGDGKEENGGGFYGNTLPKGLENCMPISVEAVMDAGKNGIQHSGRNETASSMKQRGRPKGSKNKRKGPSSEEENNRTLVRPKGSKKRVVLFGEALKRILLQKDQNQMDPAKMEEGNGSALIKDENVLNANETNVGQIETRMSTSDTNPNNVQKRGRGRPKKNFNVSENSGSVMSILLINFPVVSMCLLNSLQFTCYFL